MVDKSSGGILGGIVTSAVAAITVSSIIWNRATARPVRRLEFGSTAFGTEVYSLEQLEGLPAPVVRYFKFALSPGQPIIQNVRIKQAGEFWIGGLHPSWCPFAANHHFSARPPGFVWDASIRMAPFVTAHVRDSYIDGTGAMEAKIASLVPVVNQSKRHELAAGELHRYLSEAVWFPTVLLPGQGRSWETIDNTTARAELSHADIADGGRVGMDFARGPVALRASQDPQISGRLRENRMRLRICD
jgi:hypothetical protein